MLKRRTVRCPACAAPVEFQVGSALVTICEFCQSAVGRTDKKVEDFGKVADLAEISSPIQRGVSGQFRKKRFEVMGRVQYQHPAGGVWNEWYLLFGGDKWGWLAETQGEFFLMFDRNVGSGTSLPSRDSLSVGQSVSLGSSQFVVREIATATALSAEGDLPWAFVPGRDHEFVDLAGDNDVLASLEYGDKISLYVGKRVELADLQLSELVATIVTPELTAGSQLNCPQCAGPLTLHVPDQTERITCGNCNSLLDVTDGKLEHFQTLKTKERLPILIPLGSQGELFGDQYTVIGFLRRYAMYEGRTYPWSEYLLYNPAVGYRWLIHNDLHWSFAEPLTSALNSANESFSYNGRRFRVYDRGTAYVRSVMGEFYWKVQIGDQVVTDDFIAPPQMISFETSFAERTSEQTATLATYVEPETIEQVFGTEHVGRSWGIGPIQPRPQVGYAIFMLWPLFVVAITMIGAVCETLGSQPDSLLSLYTILFVSILPVCTLLYLWSFERKRWENSDFSPYATAD